MFACKLLKKSGIWLSMNPLPYWPYVHSKRFCISWQIASCSEDSESESGNASNNGGTEDGKTGCTPVLIAKHSPVIILICKFCWWFPKRIIIVLQVILVLFAFILVVRRKKRYFIAANFLFEFYCLFNRFR